jgi:hypothetical protein
MEIFLHTKGAERYKWLHGYDIAVECEVVMVEGTI